MPSNIGIFKFFYLEGKTIYILGSLSEQSMTLKFISKEIKSVSFVSLVVGAGQDLSCTLTTKIILSNNVIYKCLVCLSGVQSIRILLTSLW